VSTYIGTWRTCPTLQSMSALADKAEIGEHPMRLILKVQAHVARRIVGALFKCLAEPKFRAAASRYRRSVPFLRVDQAHAL